MHLGSGGGCRILTRASVVYVHVHVIYVKHVAYLKHAIFFAKKTRFQNSPCGKALTVWLGECA